MIPITTTASQADGTRLHTVPAHGVAFVQHKLTMPVGACPVSRNPESGTITIEYRPERAVVEVVSLHSALAWACSGDTSAPRSVEALAIWLCDQMHRACGVAVRVRLDLQVWPGPQRLVVDAVLPRDA